MTGLLEQECLELSVEMTRQECDALIFILRAGSASIMRNTLTREVYQGIMKILGAKP